jgi:chromatin remodeling complex protein RSC6
MSIEKPCAKLIELLETEIKRQYNLTEKYIQVKINLKFLRLILNEVKILNKYVKQINKKGNYKKGVRSGGFTIKMKISNDLSNFLKIEKDTLLTRSETTKLIQKYIIENNLQNPQNKKEIFPDKHLSELLKYEKIIHGPLYYSTIQKLIQIHFQK